MFSKIILRRAFYRPTKPLTLWRSTADVKRCSSSLSHQDEVVSVPVGGNGAVKLIISRPRQPANNNNVLVYLPPGPLFGNSSSSSSNIGPSILKNAFPTTTIVDVQYRISLQELSNPTFPTEAGRASTSKRRAQKEDSEASYTSNHRFPTPIHDVHAAWDYITDHLELYNYDTNAEGKEIYHRPRICLLGSHIGGALALTLALTDPGAVSAVAVLDGVVDWVGLDEIALENTRTDIGERDTEWGLGVGVATGTEAAQKERRRVRSLEREREKDAQRVAARELIRVRRRLFRSHSGYFDAFASPVLFLRAPGRDTPFEPMGHVEGDVMRYGDGKEEVAIVEGGNAKAFGPYDDDWHSHLSEEEAQITEADVDGPNGALEGRMEGLTLEQSMSRHYKEGTRSSTESNGTERASGASTSSSLIESDSTHTSPRSSSEPPPSPPRRRKVLRRWPPIAQPEDILLPYVNIFASTKTYISTLPSPRSSSEKHQDTLQAIDISSILNLQAIELQDLLRRACFWGREKSLAEERVLLTKLRDNESGAESERDARQIYEWLRERFDQR